MIKTIAITDTYINYFVPDEGERYMFYKVGFSGMLIPTISDRPPALQTPRVDGALQVEYFECKAEYNRFLEAKRAMQEYNEYNSFISTTKGA